MTTTEKILIITYILSSDLDDVDASIALELIRFVLETSSTYEKAFHIVVYATKYTFYISSKKELDNTPTV